MEMDPTKAQIVQSCLETSHKGFKPDKLNERFVFNDGDLGCELEFDKACIDDIPIDQLKTYLETTIIPKMKANPGKKIYASNGGIEIRNKDSK